MGLQELGQPQASFKLQGVAAVGIYVFRTDGELPAAPFLLADRSHCALPAFDYMQILTNCLVWGPSCWVAKAI